MAQPNDSRKGDPKSQQETFRTVHEVLDETACVLESSSRGLGELAEDPLIEERDRLMLCALSKVRLDAATALRKLVESAPRHGESTWLQYAPVFGNRSQLTEKISSARSGQDAYELVSDLDGEVEAALRNLAEVSPASSELLHQTEALVLGLQRSSRTVVESAQDI